MGALRFVMESLSATERHIREASACFGFGDFAY